jgi:hypothetical protein
MAKKHSFKIHSSDTFFFLSLQISEETICISAMFLFYFYKNAVNLTKDFFKICYKT